MDYTISIGSNEQRRENMELARRRLTELFFGNTFLGRGGDGTFFSFTVRICSPIRWHALLPIIR